MSLTIFRRQPAAWFAIVAAFLTVAATFNPWFTGLDLLVSALLAAVWTVVTAWKVRPMAPAVISGVIVAFADLLSRFGLHFNSAQLGAVNALGLLLFAALFVWPNVTPVGPPPVQGRVARAKVGKA